ncbi:MAG: calcium/sodium antiporter [Planctomycetes bacterium]|nr:calcium/sodium antiporter [Planctomycetota bacterium]MBL7038117.1 calcium/sodium antiporter [Pirellulaceae bacterium]
MTLTTTALFLAGFVLLVVGAEFLVRGASRLAEAAGISKLVVGLTVVAYGTSAPELAVTVCSTYAQPPRPGLAIGNVVGSNIANVLLVLGIATIVAPLVVSRSVVRIGVPLMIGVSVLMLLLGMDGQISRIDGVILFVGSLAYTIVTVVHSRRETRAAIRSQGIEHTPKPRRLVLTQIAVNLGLILGGLIVLVLGSRWLVQGAVEVANLLGVSGLIIGLTIVAIGTSLPEVATSIVAVLRGERDIAVGNVVGSNIFNILLVLGGCGIVSPDNVLVSQAALRFDIPIMIVVAVACLPVFFVKYTIERWEGFVFLIYYAAYLTYLCLHATEHDALGAFSNVMIMFVAPLTALTFVIYWYRVFTKKRGQHD